MMTDYQYTYVSNAQALYEALTEDAFYIAMEKAAADDGQNAKEAMTAYMDYSMIEAREFGELTLPEKEGIGAAIWSKPIEPERERLKAEKKKKFLYEYMGPRSLEVYARTVDSMSEMTARVASGDFWYLSIIGLAPEYQGRGLGKTLLDPVLQETDRLGIPTFLETFTPGNMTFYRRIGYETARTFFEPTANAEYSVMIRKPG